MNIQEKIDKDIADLEKFLMTKTFKDLAIVFDVGTKGVRALVGPKMSLTKFREWDPDISDIFYIASLNAQLGREFEKDYGLLEFDSKPLNDTIRFISAIRRKLSFVDKQDIVLVGTAVFRWIANSFQILSYMAKSTGLNEIKVLNEVEEAYYSLLSITYTHDKISGNRFAKKTFTETDVILLFDQGGGSTEVSYLFPKNPQETELTSMFYIGTVKLEHNFFLKYREQKFITTSNRVTIEESLERVTEYIHGQIDGLQKFNKILPPKSGGPNPYNIIAFGMGTALKVCFEQYFGRLLNRKISGKKFKGWNITLAQMEETFRIVKLELVNAYGNVEAILKNSPKNGRAQVDDLNSKLQMLYALETYMSLMKKFGISSMNYAYFNLKYGVFLQNFITGVSAISVPPKNLLQKDKSEIKSAKQRISVLKELTIGAKDANYFHDFIFDSLKFIFGVRLANAKKEKPLNDGRKRIDIVFDNVDKKGFFLRLISHYQIKCPKIVIECKNNADLKNPAFEQLSGRLSKRRLNFGILVCRSIVDPRKAIQTCRDLFWQKDELIIVLQDSDIEELLRMKEYNQETEIDDYLETKLDPIIM